MKGATYAEFLRLTLAPTALSNVSAAYLLGGGRSLTTLEWLWLSALLLYAFGMGLNDLVDWQRDKKLHPRRPLPSGRMKWREGLVLCALLWGGALTLVWGRLPERLFWFGLLTLAIVGYNLVGKRVLYLAPLSMASCRGLLYAFGLGEWQIEPILIVGGYTGWLTFLSLGEEELWQRRFLAVGLGWGLWGLCCLCSLPLLSQISWLGGGAFLAWMAVGSGKVLQAEAPEQVAQVVWRALWGFVPLDALLLTSLLGG